MCACVCVRVCTFGCGVRTARPQIGEMVPIPQKTQIWNLVQTNDVVVAEFCGRFSGPQGRGPCLPGERAGSRGGEEARLPGARGEAPEPGGAAVSRGGGQGILMGGNRPLRFHARGPQPIHLVDQAPHERYICRSARKECPTRLSFCECACLEHRDVVLLDSAPLINPI